MSPPRAGGDRDRSCTLLPATQPSGGDGCSPRTAWTGSGHRHLLRGLVAPWGPGCDWQPRACEGYPSRGLPQRDWTPKPCSGVRERCVFPLVHGVASHLELHRRGKGCRTFSPMLWSPKPWRCSLCRDCSSPSGWVEGRWLGGLRVS